MPNSLSDLIIELSSKDLNSLEKISEIGKKLITEKLGPITTEIKLVEEKPIYHQLYPEISRNGKYRREKACLTSSDRFLHH